MKHMVDPKLFVPFDEYEVEHRADMVQPLVAAGRQGGGYPSAVRFRVGVEPCEPHDVAEHVAQHDDWPCVYRTSGHGQFVEVQPVSVVLPLVAAEWQRYDVVFQAHLSL